MFCALVRAAVFRTMLLLNQAVISTFTTDIFEMISQQTEEKTYVSMPGITGSKSSLTFSEDLSLKSIDVDFNLFLTCELVSDPLQQSVIGTKDRSVLGTVRSTSEFYSPEGQTGQVSVRSHPLKHAWFCPETPRFYIDLVYRAKKSVRGIQDKKHKPVGDGAFYVEAGENGYFKMTSDEHFKDWLIINKLS